MLTGFCDRFDIFLPENGSFSESTWKAWKIYGSAILKKDLLNMKYAPLCFFFLAIIALTKSNVWKSCGLYPEKLVLRNVNTWFSCVNLILWLSMDWMTTLMVKYSSVKVTEFGTLDESFIRQILTANLSTDNNI